MLAFRSIITVVGLLVLIHSVSAADTTSGRDRLAGFLRELTTLDAHFEQQLFDEYGEAMESATGTVAISRPGKFLWEYQQPYSQLIVSNGSTLWVFDADLEQVTINPFSQGGAGSPAELLVGDVDLDRHYDIAETYGDDGVIWVLLTPRDESAQYRAINIGLDADGLRGMKLHDNLNQLTVIKFDNVRRNIDIADERFEFVPPPGVDVINGAGN